MFAAEPRGRRIARLLLMAFYGLAGVAHLVFTDAMVRIVPAWVPEPRAVVITTGLCELVGVIGLTLPRWRRTAGWAFAAYAVCVFPANIVHAMHDLGSGTGLPLWYHAPRLLLQPAIVWWALWATGALKRPPAAR
ncbi:DoxX family protein [Sphingomonas sp.]|uniref:DoxX family protein n=1 Tax=Sphingomonas sp. TaxID=28214 RepID=UPI0035C7E8FE